MRLLSLRIGVFRTAILTAVGLFLVVSCRESIQSSSVEKPVVESVKPATGSLLGATARSVSKNQSGESGFLLLDRGDQALAWRTRLADAAESTIDAQYFLWKNDDAGKIMMQRLIAAADRGVRDHGHRGADPVAPAGAPVRRPDQEGQAARPRPRDHGAGASLTTNARGGRR